MSALPRASVIPPTTSAVLPHLLHVLFVMVGTFSSFQKIALEPVEPSRNSCKLMFSQRVLANPWLVQKYEDLPHLIRKTLELNLYARAFLWDQAEMILPTLLKTVPLLGFLSFLVLLLPLPHQFLPENTLINHLLLSSCLGVSFWET